MAWPWRNLLTPALLAPAFDEDLKLWAADMLQMSTWTEPPRPNGSRCESQVKSALGICPVSRPRAGKNACLLLRQKQTTSCHVVYHLIDLFPQDAQRCFLDPFQKPGLMRRSGIACAMRSCKRRCSKQNKSWPPLSSKRLPLCAPGSHLWLDESFPESVSREDLQENARFGGVTLYKPCVPVDFACGNFRQWQVSSPAVPERAGKCGLTVSHRGWMGRLWKVQDLASLGALSGTWQVAPSACLRAWASLSTSSDQNPCWWVSALALIDL